VNYLIALFLITCLSGCNTEKGDEYITNLKAADYFEKVESICNKDNGDLWGMNLYGPLMLVDVETRRIFANMPDSSGLLKPRDGIYTGIYPGDQVISNFAVTFGNTLFAMAPLPEKEDNYRITARCLHGLFHCFQNKKGIDNQDFSPTHMNEQDARIWLKMEWKALERAIKTKSTIREQAIRDALIFRNTRREIYPTYTEDENLFENYEGLATFTYMLLASDSRESYTMALLEYLHRIYNFSFTHSYGFVHGALYAYLLHDYGFDFSTINTPGVDLGEKLLSMIDITLPEVSRDVAGSLAVNYDIEMVRREEDERSERIREGLHRRTSAFTDKPVIYFTLESPSFVFEPEDIEPADSLGVIYKKLKVTDNWGKLVVSEGGCLVSPNLRYMRVPARSVRIDRYHITGDGWHIYLSENWRMDEMDNNYYIRKLIP
jgi:hypothetical protein